MRWGCWLGWRVRSQGWIGGVRFRVVVDEDWERVWMDQFQAMRFGERTFIVPWNQAVPVEASGMDAAVVRLDPGLAFGSGTHPTTGLCLRWLDRLGGWGVRGMCSILGVVRAFWRWPL